MTGYGKRILLSTIGVLGAFALGFNPGTQLAGWLYQIAPMGGVGPYGSVSGGACTPASGYSHCRVLSVDHTQVGGSTLTGFPVLVQATLGSGRIQNANCYDVIFTSDSGGTTLIPWETEPADGCNPSTGAIVMWVLPGSVSAAANTKIYVSYDNPSIAAAQNTGSNGPTHVWNSNYQAVWHLGEATHASNASTDSDSTSNGNTLTNNNTTFSYGYASGAGVIGNGLIGNSTTDASGRNGAYSSLGTGIALAGAWSVSFWWNPPAGAINASEPAIGAAGTYMVLFQTGSAYVRDSGGTYAGVSYGTLNSGTWYHFAFVSDSAHNVTFYRNGVSLGTGSLTAGNTLSGVYGFNGGGYSGGAFDELHIVSSNLPSGWWAAEVNNQQPGSTFLTVGAEI